MTQADDVMDTDRSIEPGGCVSKFEEQWHKDTKALRKTVSLGHSVLDIT
ncbi:hypothetical protein [Boseongicola aestuarii]|nr:hypothetical protein [Boseongicola aestuarii]